MRTPSNPRSNATSLSQRHTLRQRIARWSAGVAVFALSACDAQPTPAAEEPEDWTNVPVQFANLQVLPETIERDELILYMRTISRSLGVRCAHCHDMLTEDYAADDVEAKRIARDMMRLVEEFNTLTGTRPDATTVTCNMCHRGALKPPATDPLHSGA